MTAHGPIRMADLYGYPPALMTTRDAARFLSVSPGFLPDLMKDADIYPVHLGKRRIAWKTSDLLSYVDSLPDAGETCRDQTDQADAVWAAAS